MKITYSLVLEMRMWTSLGVIIEPSTVSWSLFVSRSVLWSALSLEKLTMLVCPSSLAFQPLAGFGKREAPAGDLGTLGAGNVLPQAGPELFSKNLRLPRVEFTSVLSNKHLVSTYCVSGTGASTGESRM